MDFTKVDINDHISVLNMLIYQLEGFRKTTNNHQLLEGDIAGYKLLKEYPMCVFMQFMEAKDKCRLLANRPSNLEIVTNILKNLSDQGFNKYSH